MRRVVSGCVAGLCAACLLLLTLMPLHAVNGMLVEVPEFSDIDFATLADGTFIAWAGGWRSGSGSLVCGKRYVSAELRRVWGDYFQVLPETMLSGRPIFPKDAGRKIVMIDERTASALFGTVDCVGEMVSLSGEAYTVYGVYRRDESPLGLNAQALPVAFVPAAEETGFTRLCLGFADGVDQGLAVSAAERALERQDIVALSSVDLSRRESNAQAFCGVCLLLLALLLCALMPALHGKKRWFCLAGKLLLIVLPLALVFSRVSLDPAMLPVEPSEKAFADTIHALLLRMNSPEPITHPYLTALAWKQRIAAALLILGAAGLPSAMRNKR
ncbi:MAG: ABC transporter permease [Christensenellaceae bacterium]|nr:ABC transporter permease [Christensenellaceae bacterium]